MSPTVTDPLEVMKTDLDGLYHAHVRALEDFSGTRLNALLVVYALPLLCLGALVASPGSTAELGLKNPFAFPVAAHLVFLAASVLGLCVTRMWVASYLLGQWYARGINVLRGVYVPILRASLQIDELKWLPTKSEMPPWKTGLFVVWVASAFCGLSGGYFALGLGGLIPWFDLHLEAGIFLVVLTILASVGVAIGGYCRVLQKAAKPKA